MTAAAQQNKKVKQQGRGGVDWVRGEQHEKEKGRELVNKQ